jgi:hypothetical protein
MSIVFEVPISDGVRLYVEEMANKKYKLICFDVERKEVNLEKNFGNIDEAIKYCKFYQPFVKEYMG